MNLEEVSALVRRDDQPKIYQVIPLTTLNDPSKAAEEVQRIFNLFDTPTHLYDKCKCVNTYYIEIVVFICC